MKIIPDSKPQLTKQEAEKIVKHYLGANTPPIVLVGIRGYYSKTMGETEGNDINLYDDAMIIWGLNTYKTFNGNTDPSFVKKNGSELAKLNEGVYKFYRGKHKNKYNALRSYPEGVVLPCTRAGKAANCSYINIHKGGMNPADRANGVTYSHGCQTLPPTQWEDYIENVYAGMNRNGMTTITYILLTAEQMNAILES